MTKGNKIFSLLLTFSIFILLTLKGLYPILRHDFTGIPKIGILLLLMLFLTFSVFSLFIISFYGSNFLVALIGDRKNVSKDVILNGTFSITTILLIFTAPIFNNFFEGIEFYVVIIILSTTPIFISRSLVISLKKIEKNKIVLWICAILLGIGSFGVFWVFAAIVFRGVDGEPKQAIGFAVLIGGLIIIIISILKNIKEIKRSNRDFRA